MASNNSKKPEQVTTPQAAPKNEPTYTIEECAVAHETFGVTRDIVTAALTVSSALNGKKEFTIQKAKEIIKSFNEKGVK